MLPSRGLGHSVSMALAATETREAGPGLRPTASTGFTEADTLHEIEEDDEDHGALPPRTPKKGRLPQAQQQQQPSTPVRKRDSQHSALANIATQFALDGAPDGDGVATEGMRRPMTPTLPSSRNSPTVENEHHQYRRASVSSQPVPRREQPSADVQVAVLLSSIR